VACPFLYLADWKSQLGVQAVIVTRRRSENIFLYSIFE